MKGTKRSTAVYVIFAGASFAQTSAPAPAFEVASIRPSPPISMAAVQSGKAHVGITIDPTRVDMGYFALGDLIRYAFRIPKRHQVIGPDWMNGEHFDIAAKLPENARRQQIPEMLQALLVERFRMKVHRETREMAVFALTLSDSGLKLQRAAPPEPATPPAGDDPGTGQVLKPIAQAGVRFVNGPDGVIHLTCARMSLQGLAQTLSGLVDRPVFDETNIEGEFKIDLMVSREEMNNMSRGAGAMVMMPPGMAEMGRSADESSRAELNGSLFASLRSAGLKLSARKAPFEVLVIDHVERTPVEN